VVRCTEPARCTCCLLAIYLINSKTSSSSRAGLTTAGTVIHWPTQWERANFDPPKLVNHYFKPISTTPETRNVHLQTVSTYPVQNLISIRRRGWSGRIPSMPHWGFFLLFFFLLFFVACTGRTIPLFMTMWVMWPWGCVVMPLRSHLVG